MLVRVLLFCLLETVYLTATTQGRPRPQHPITTINIYTKPHSHPNAMHEMTAPQYEVACLADGSCPGGSLCRNGFCPKAEVKQQYQPGAPYYKHREEMAPMEDRVYNIDMNNILGNTRNANMRMEGYPPMRNAMRSIASQS